MSQDKEKIVITGGSGFVGKHLTKLLLSEGYYVVHLSRSVNSKAGVKTYEWNIKKKTVDVRALENASHIIHLAGAGVADKPWTYKRKLEIVKSRIDGIPVLLEAVQKNNIALKSFITSSGINYYGTKTSEHIYTESDQAGDDFLAKTCVYWENYADKFSPVSRVVKLRTGVVLDKNEGALVKMMEPFKYGLGAAIGSGQQYMPWIHVDDLCRMYLHAIKNTTLNGAYNACAPQHITNTDITKHIAKFLNKKLWLPNVPSFIMKLLLGDMAGILLQGSRCSCDKIISTGFVFEKDSLEKLF